MKNFNRLKKIIAASILSFALNPTLAEFQKVEAAYRSSSDTGTEIFDFIENRRRDERANALTEEQKKLQKDIAEATERLPKPMEEGKPIPAAFEGDDLVYNAVTGEFVATGSVDIIQLEGYRFQSEKAEGNVKTQEVRVKDKAHVLQLTKDAPRVTLDGYNTVYNYGTKIGTMGEAKGKTGEYYISGKRFEFYPDHVVAYDATQTKCNAHHPDYHVSAERMEIWPEQIIRMYNVKLWIRDKMVGKKEYEERRLDTNEETYFPRVGYNSDYGAYVEDTFEFPLRPHFQAILNAHLETKKGLRTNAELQYINRNTTVRSFYGFYRDDNAHWIQKEPGMEIFYSKHLDNAPLTYAARYEIGHWRSETAKSLHQEIAFDLYPDTFILPHKFVLSTHIGYKITKDNIDQPVNNTRNTIRGMNYDIVLGKEFNDRFAAFTGYHYTKNTTKNSVYNFGLEDYAKRFETGISYQLTDKDRFVAGFRFDLEDGSLKDVDFYWYRDLHCSTAVMRWRHKRKKLEMHWQFTPW